MINVNIQKLSDEEKIYLLEIIMGHINSWDKNKKWITFNEVYDVSRCPRILAFKILKYRVRRRRYSIAEVQALPPAIRPQDIGSLGEIAVLEALSGSLDESVQIEKREVLSRAPEDIIAETFSKFDQIKKKIRG